MKSKLDRFYESFAAVIIEKKWLFIVIIVLLTVLMVMQIPKMRADFSNEAFFKEDDEEILKYNRMKEAFGNDETVYILFEAENFFQPEVVEKIRKLQDEIGGIKYKDNYIIGEVQSLINVKYIEGKEGELVVSELIGSNTDINALKEAKQKALNDEILLNQLISKDGKYIGIMINIREVEGDGEFRKVITREIRKIFQKPEYKEFEFHAVGVPIYDHDADVITGEESVIYLCVSLLVIAVLLFWLFRSFLIMIGPLIDVLLSTFFSYCLMAAFNMPITLLTIPIPLIIMTIGVADSIHIISKYYAKYHLTNDKKETLKIVLRETAFPCLFTTITTVLAFMVLILNQIKPIQHLGIVCSIGVFFSYFMSIILVPIMLPKIKTGKAETKFRIIDKILIKIGTINQKRKLAIMGISLVILIVSFYGVSKVEVDTIITKDFREDSLIVKDYNFIDDHMGGAFSLEILLSQPDKKDVRNPGFLGDVEKILSYLESREDVVVKIFSINHILKRIHKELNAGDPAYYKIPASEDLIKQELFLFGMSDEDTLSRILDYENKETRVIVRTKTQSSKEYTKFIQDVKDYIARQVQSVHTVFTGGFSQMVRMAEYVSKGQVISYSLAFLVVCIAMMFVFSSIKIGLISMIPNVLPVAIALGFMGIAGIPLDFFALLIACIMIGIIVDDSIHIISEYRRKYSELKDYEEAGKETLKDVGRAVYTTSIILVLAFLATIFSQSLGVANFGLLCAVTIFSALIFDLFLTPCLIEFFKPFEKKEQK